MAENGCDENASMWWGKGWDEIKYASCQANSWSISPSQNNILIKMANIIDYFARIVLIYFSALFFFYSLFSITFLLQFIFTWMMDLMKACFFNVVIVFNQICLTLIIRLFFHALISLLHFSIQSPPFYQLISLTAGPYSQTFALPFPQMETDW